MASHFFDQQAIAEHLSGLKRKLQRTQEIVGRSALTTAEKILYAHIPENGLPSQIVRGESSLNLQPDRTIMQDATAQMAILQFMQSGRAQVAVPSSVHCDHLIRAQSGAKEDLERAIQENREVYDFLRSASAKYGIHFWGPGSGIIHQVVLEKYALPGALIIGTDSHTPNAGGLGSLAIGVGGADVADVMAGLSWSLRAPKLIGVHLKGKLSGWTAPKDVILKLCGLLSTKGGTNKIIEYFGEGARNISTTGKATITNMGAELGATTSVFPFDEKAAVYLALTERREIAELAQQYQQQITADPAVEQHPEDYFDEVVEIDLDHLEPHLVGPHSPDVTRTISEFPTEAQQKGYPREFKAALIGSCTNSSYEDLGRVAAIARQALKKQKKLKVYLLITPGSDQVYQTIKRDGQLAVFEELGATVLANACGPCIGNWDRSDIAPGESNAIITSFNRNFPKRNDGNTDTLSFIASPELVLAYALHGELGTDPRQELDAPIAPENPESGFVLSEEGFCAPPADGSTVKVQVAVNSQRLEILQPFPAWDGNDFLDLPVLLKTQGQTTTDHISPAGRDWLPLRGHLSGISHNLLLGAVDAETGQPAEGIPLEVNGKVRKVSPWALKAKEYQQNAGGCVIVGDENYGEGSSREHAAMSPRLLGVKAVIARSFARIHETNLKKQGILPLTFQDPADYEQLSKSDRVSVRGLKELQPNRPLKMTLCKSSNGNTLEIALGHSLTTEQIHWFQAGSAMNAANSRPA